MGILDNLESYMEFEENKKTQPYKVACSKCLKLFISASDDPFICLMCSQ
jgi:hypothetical protein